MDAIEAVASRELAVAESRRGANLNHLLSEVAPEASLAPDVERALLALAEDFSRTATRAGCELARHRGAETVGVRDLRDHVEGELGHHVAGFGYRRARSKAAGRGQGSEEHKARKLLVVKKRKLHQQATGA